VTLGIGGDGMLFTGGFTLITTQLLAFSEKLGKLSLFVRKEIQLGFTRFWYCRLE
jgi:hypothetical protein